MDNSPAMIFLKDKDGHYLHFNRQFGAFHQLEECIGKTDADLFRPSGRGVSDNDRPC
jgi:PAS domain-containing protein